MNTHSHTHVIDKSFSGLSCFLFSWALSVCCPTVATREEMPKCVS